MWNAKTYILRNQPSNQDRARLDGRKHVAARMAAAQDPTVHPARRQAEVGRAATVHLTHDSVRDLAVDFVEQGLASCEDVLCCLVVAVGRLGCRCQRVVEEMGRGAFFESVQSVDGLYQGGYVCFLAKGRMRFCAPVVGNERRGMVGGRGS